MKFIVDAMLGTLAKWLRVLGFDTIYETDLGDDEILSIAERDGRAIISRDRELCGRRVGSILMETTDLDEQIALVVESYPVNKKDILSRCLGCNSILDIVPKDEAKGNVPEGVIERHVEFWKCHECNKFYWPGSHWSNMKLKAEKFLR